MKLAVIFTAALANSQLLLAQEISERGKAIGNEFFFREEAIELLYANDPDATQQIFACSEVEEHPSPQGQWYYSCVYDGEAALIDMSMGPENHFSSVSVAVLSTRDAPVDELIEMSLDTAPIESNQGYQGTQYFMGMTDGWRRDFVNIFFDGSSRDGLPFRGWTLLRR